MGLREQMCGFDDYFNIDIGQNVEITLYEPVLLESDVYLLKCRLATIVRILMCRQAGCVLR